VLFFGTYDAARYPRVQVLREGFEAVGDEVLECNVPLRFPTERRVELLRSPWRAASFGLRLLAAWAVLVRRALRLRNVDLVVVGYMGQFDVHLARVLWRRVPIALDHLVPAGEAAVDRRCSRGWLVRALRRLDDAAVAAADVVCVDTVDHLDLITGPAVRVVVPVGAPSAWFEAPPAGPAANLRVVFFGSFTPLQGATVIAEAAALLADAPVELTFVGRGQDWEAARRLAASNPRVRWVDWIDPSELPAAVAGHDVCLGIFGAGEKARRVVPTKVFQGAAAGLAVVTSDTPPQRATLADAAAFVPPGDARALARTLAALARDPERVAELRRRSRALARSSFRPETVVEPLLARLRESTRSRAA
jgi:glycosyltransferase involved in cell wall biosynthesis